MTKRIYRQTDWLYICRDSQWVTDNREWLNPCSSHCGPTMVKDLPDWAIRQLIEDGRATLRIKVGA